MFNMTLGTGIFLSILSICITILILRLSKLLIDKMYEKTINRRKSQTL